MENLINTGYSFELSIKDYNNNTNTSKYSDESKNIGKDMAIQLIDIVNQDIYSDDFDVMTNEYNISLNLTIPVKLDTGNVEYHNFYFYLNDSYKNTKDFIDNAFIVKN
jgi:hypothetical protein